MSVHTAVHGALKKLTDKGQGGVTNHHVEALADGTFVHSIMRKAHEEKGKQDNWAKADEEERHTHSNVHKLTRCINDCHSGVVED